MSIRLLGAVAAAAVLTATGPAAPVHAASTGVTGTWQSVGYGHVFTITSGHDGRLTLTIAQRTAISCLVSDSVKRQVGGGGRTVAFGLNGSRLLTVHRQGRQLVAHILGTVSDIRLDRLAHPLRCVRPAASGAAARLRAFDVFWQTLAENYPPFPHRHVDWKERSIDRAALVKHNTEDELRTLLRRADTMLGDTHTEIVKGEDDFDGRRPGTRDSGDPGLERARVRTAIATRLGQLGGTLTPLTGGGSVEYADGLPGRVGYLRITSMENLLGGGDGEDPDFDSDGKYDQDHKALAAALDKVFTIAREHHWNGLIVDLRYNGGGFDQLGLDLAARLTEARHPVAAYRKRTRDLSAPGGFHPFHTVSVTPSRRPGFHGRVAVLVSDLTVSAAETTTTALLQTVSHRHVRPALIGMATQGAFSDQLKIPLPDGWSLSTSNEDFRTVGGVSYEGTGIPVPAANRTPVFTRSELDRGCDSAIARALTLFGHPVTACASR